MFSRLFINRPIFACVISIIIMILGGVTIPFLPVEQTPDITPPTVEVKTSYPGASPEVIAETVAAPLEQEINELSVDVLGYRGFPMDPVEGGNPYREHFTASVVPRYLNNRAASIFGGSQEVQRNIVAKLVLGL